MQIIYTIVADSTISLPLLLKIVYFILIDNRDSPLEEWGLKDIQCRAQKAALLIDLLSNIFLIDTYFESQPVNY